MGGDAAPGGSDAETPGAGAADEEPSGDPVSLAMGVTGIFSAEDDVAGGVVNFRRFASGGSSWSAVPRSSREVTFVALPSLRCGLALVGLEGAEFVPAGFFAGDPGSGPRKLGSNISIIPSDIVKFFAPLIQ